MKERLDHMEYEVAGQGKVGGQGEIRRISVVEGYVYKIRVNRGRNKKKDGGGGDGGIDR